MNTRFALSSTTLALCLALLTACGGSDNGDPGGDPSASGSFALSSQIDALPAEPLSAAEADSLSFMREEEKLAGDVYVHLNALWGEQTRTFGNIANSEDTHTEAVRQLLQRYGLPDPSAGLAEGQFTHPELQALYGQLTQSGQASLAAALSIGMTIEELDIRDLELALNRADNQDIRFVYTELIRGSGNHLRAFHRSLEQTGTHYTPRYLSQAAFDAIVNQPAGRR